LQQKPGETAGHLRIALADGFNAWDAFPATVGKSGPTWTDERTGKALRKGRKPAEGDKRQFLTTMDREVIAVKKAAIEEDSRLPRSCMRPRKSGWSGEEEVMDRELDGNAVFSV
jgi:hypothetical protein